MPNIHELMPKELYRSSGGSAVTYPEDMVSPNGMRPEDQERVNADILKKNPRLKQNPDGSFSEKKEQG